MDFTNMNSACPKDSFPLSRIDQLIYSTARHKLLTFMDAYLGYNQIKTSEEDQENATFVTSQRLYCYKVMPFRLKNAGAFYQRLVNRMFSKQIERNMEVYVDNMLVKSKEENTHPEKIQAILEMTSLKIMKERQTLTGRIVALNKFVSKAIERCLPFFKTLKQVFVWTIKCEEVFQELNCYLSSPPLLSPSKEGKDLFLYLVVSTMAVSATLI